MSSLFNNNSKKKKIQKKSPKKKSPKTAKKSPKKVKKCHLNIWAQRDKQTQRAGTRLPLQVFFKDLFVVSYYTKFAYLGL